ncbi:MAG: hypothetical protein ACTS73_02060 [Arsenophonus sp. NEOnobi-MAG3]
MLPGGLSYTHYIYFLADSIDRVLSEKMIAFSCWSLSAVLSMDVRS